ncbi:pimeloyl-ACP methyl ester carboxylesterase [Caulobacter ginsengisoli]|uniref:Pimeloyl-ACP methyl ester carboxylesterase n=1 Tax=Caulobacter ginsengisoli TaxID=400775 RepID=A0ABU0IU12_9CAUL|nr:alpha/beta hydrolase [Caulobacter ginsengisoli]MDQ0465484.1 pimeloyl-ACP methyl ester carboxylesterase [Caulobacter ginsengisoli]
MLSLMVVLSAGVAAAQDAVGDWKGTLSVNGRELRLQVHIVKTPAGGLSGTLDSLEQGAKGLQLSGVASDGQALSFDLPAASAHFAGVWNGTAWAGQWSQGGVNLTLALEPGSFAPTPAANRPQTPRPPFPYQVVDVTFDGGGGAKLAGTLTLPQGQGPFPAVVLISGSGPNDRDETLKDHKPFAVIADALTRRGIAVLRYDKRGVGQSTGVYATATSVDFADDATAAAAFLRARPDIAPGRIGLIGHSEGGLIAPMVAARDPKLAFLVLLAGPAISGTEILKLQVRAKAEASGAAPADVERRVAFEARLLGAIAGKDEAAAKAGIDQLLAETPGLDPNVAAASRQLASSAWFRNFVAYDPAPALKALRIPVLALYGDKDFQVPPAANVPVMTAALKGDRDATVTVLPGLNHLFQLADTGLDDEYGQIEETISPAALDRLGAWVVAHAK